MLDMAKTGEKAGFDGALVKKMVRRLSECIDDQGKVKPC